MRFFLAVLTFLAVLPVFAACTEHACSDDVDGVLGNEELAWDAVADATRYEVAALTPGGTTVCATVINSTSYLVSGTPCDEINVGSGFVVRACNDAGCGPWSNVVEILPHACLRATDWDPCLYHDANGDCEGGHRTRCEHPCYDWQDDVDWRRLPDKYEECP